MNEEEKIKSQDAEGEKPKAESLSAEVGMEPVATGDGQTVNGK